MGSPTIRPPAGHDQRAVERIAERFVDARGRAHAQPGLEAKRQPTRERQARRAAVEDRRDEALDVKNGVWADHWVNAKGGVMTAPGVLGGFTDGVGIFESDEEDEQGPLKARGVWDRITKTSCRWSQATSRDGGKTWDVNWSMDWTRVA